MCLWFIRHLIGELANARLKIVHSAFWKIDLKLHLFFFPLSQAIAEHNGEVLLVAAISLLLCRAVQLSCNQANKRIQFVLSTQNKPLKFRKFQFPWFFLKNCAWIE